MTLSVARAPPPRTDAASTSAAGAVRRQRSLRRQSVMSRPPLANGASAPNGHALVVPELGNQLLGLAVGAMAPEQHQDICVPPELGARQGRVAVPLGDVDARAMGKQQFGHVRMVLLDGGEQRRDTRLVARIVEV